MMVTKKAIPRRTVLRTPAALRVPRELVDLDGA